MGADPGRRVVAVAPVHEVVPGLLTGKREVADLVLRVAGALEELDGDAVLAHRAGTVDRRHQSAADARVQWRAGLDRELVAGDVRGTGLRDPLERAPPAGVAETGHGVDQVAVDRIEACGADLANRGDRPVGVVDPAEEAQGVGLEALHADADAVHPRVLPDPSALRGDARGVRLHRELGSGRDGERAPDRGHQVGEQGGLDQRRSAATDEDGVEGQPAEALTEAADLSAERLHVLLGPGGARDAREIAVLALPLAERDVQVQRAHLAEAGGHAVGSLAPESRADASSILSTTDCCVCVWVCVCLALRPAWTWVRGPTVAAGAGA